MAQPTTCALLLLPLLATFIHRYGEDVSVLEMDDNLV
jgi:hypothetical protein